MLGLRHVTPHPASITVFILKGVPICISSGLTESNSAFAEIVTLERQFAQDTGLVVTETGRGLDLLLPRFFCQDYIL